MRREGGEGGGEGTDQVVLILGNPIKGKKRGICVDCGEGSPVIWAPYPKWRGYG